jgi:hypothetical protein
MQEYKANLARVWMVNGSRNQDWILSIQDQALGRDYNLEEAWAFDAILDQAHQTGTDFPPKSAPSSIPGPGLAWS